MAGGDNSGISVSGAGDVNGDGLADVIIGANGADPHGGQSGAAYVVFGKASGFTASLDLSTLDGISGFKIGGVAADDELGRAVSGAGDVNGDGFGDLIVGAHQASAGSAKSGASYVIFGKASGFTADLDLTTLDGITGFKISGEAENDASGFALSGAGDVNGDTFDDVIIGAYGANANGDYCGASYVVFGRANGFTANLDLADLDGTNGFKINGEAALDSSGSAVSGAGDVNGDGIDDVIIGAAGDDSHDSTSGASYVVFGNSSGFAATLELADLDGTDGFKILGEGLGDLSGTAVSGAGDVNGDGFDDVIIGANGSDPHGSLSGTSYVVFGSGSGFAPAVELAFLDGSNGFKIFGEKIGDYSGTKVSRAGDVNNDGYGDLIIGANGVDAHGNGSGASYVVFGKGVPFAPALELSKLTGGNGYKLLGAAAGDISGFAVNAAGDVNGDGYDDLIVGSLGADPHGAGSGSSYVVFGGGAVALSKDHRSATFTDADGDLVTIKTNKGTLSLNEFFLTPQNALGGATLLAINLQGHAELTGATFTVTAKQTSIGGNSFVNVGHFNALGLSLKAVSIGGDLGRFEGGPIKTLTVGSFGLAGLATQAGPGASLVSQIVGDLGSLTVKSEIRDATVAFGGKVGTIKIGGNITDAGLLIKGTMAPTTNAAALALKSLTVSGNVENSQILVGHDLTGGVNADVQIGTVTINHHWLASDLVAGVVPGDAFYGDANDVLISGGTDIMAKIAKVTFKGQAQGTTAPGDQFGIVAESVGSVTVGRTKIPLTTGHDHVVVGNTGDFWVREV